MCLLCVPRRCIWARLSHCLFPSLFPHSQAAVDEAHTKVEALLLKLPGTNGICREANKARMVRRREARMVEREGGREGGRGGEGKLSYSIDPTFLFLF